MKPTDHPSDSKRTHHLRDATSPSSRHSDLSELSEITGDLYERAQDWLMQNPSRKYGMLAIVAAAGVIGFAVGRSFATESPAPKNEI